MDGWMDKWIDLSQTSHQMKSFSKIKFKCDFLMNSECSENF
jgi:hypothetical protein